VMKEEAGLDIPTCILDVMSLIVRFPSDSSEEPPPTYFDSQSFSLSNS